MRHDGRGRHQGSGEPTAIATKVSELLAIGLTPRRIAQQLDINPMTVYRIRNGGYDASTSHDMDEATAMRRGTEALLDLLQRHHPGGHEDVPTIRPARALPRVAWV